MSNIDRMEYIDRLAYIEKQIQLVHQTDMPDVASFSITFRYTIVLFSYRIIIYTIN